MLQPHTTANLQENKKNFLAPTPYHATTYDDSRGPDFLHVAKDPVAA